MDINHDNHMVMRCTAYKQGLSLGDVTIEDISEVLKEPDTFVWLGLHEANTELLLKIQEEFELHELAIEDACNAHQQPKIEDYNDTLFIVLQTAALKDDSVSFGETHVFVGKRFVVTVRHGSMLDHRVIRLRCEAKPEHLSPGYVLYAIIDFIVDSYLPVIEQLSARFEQLELSIFENQSNHKTLQELYRLKRELLILHSAITPVIDICNNLMRFHDPIISKEVGVYFRDIADHIRRIDQTIDSLREMLIAAMQVHLTFETVRQNEVVKGLAGWGAILAIPTLVFSLYGMNFKYMPELNWAYSYPLVLGGVLISCVLLYARLKRLGWI